jgi:hypothetical protein
MESFSRNEFGVKTPPRVEDLNDCLEGAQGQDWKWNQNQKREGFTLNAHTEGIGERANFEEQHCAPQTLANETEKSKQQPFLPNPDSKSGIQRPEQLNATDSRLELNQFSGGLQAEPAPLSGGLQVEPAPSVRAVAAGSVTSAPGGHSRSSGNSFREREKSLAVARELRVGQGPRCGPVRVKPEALERIRAREGSRSP